MHRSLRFGRRTSVTGAVAVSGPTPMAVDGHSDPTVPARRQGRGQRRIDGLGVRFSPPAGSSRRSSSPRR